MKQKKTIQTKRNNKPKQRNQNRNKNRECTHRRIKKNYNFGRKSTPTMVCKDCGELVTPYLLFKQRSQR